MSGVCSLSVGGLGLMESSCGLHCEFIDIFGGAFVFGQCPRINDFQQIPFYDSMICLPQPVQTVFSDQFLGSCKRLALIKRCSVIILKQGQAYTLPVGPDEEFKRLNPSDP